MVLQQFFRDTHEVRAGVVSRLSLGGALLVLLGLVATLLAAPVVVGALAVKAGADAYRALPDELTLPSLAQRSRILAADGSHVAWLYAENRVRVPLAHVPQHVRDAVLAVEDARFYDHRGVDVRGTLRALATNLAEGGVAQGGSTLTQQYVKNARLAQAEDAAERDEAVGQSVRRKLEEARLALDLEQAISKDEILQRYLNIAYFGEGAYGIAAAADRYFSVPVQELTLAQGALLAGLLQAPERLDPVRAPEAALARRGVVLARMTAAGLLDEAARAEAAATPLGLRLRPLSSGCAAPGVEAPFFCDLVRRTLEDTPVGAALGTTREERQVRLLTGGLTIRTTLQPALQAQAQLVLAQRIPSTDPSGVAATFTAVQPGTGQVLAAAVNRRYGADRLGYTKVPLPLGGSSGMQAGSTFKPFVLAAALQQGLPLDTTFDAPARYTSTTFTTCEDGECGLPYEVANAGDSSAGRHDLVSATHLSVNTAYLQLLEKTGVEQPARIAESLGLRQFRGGDPVAPLHRGGSFVLGANEVSPLDLTAAYAAFAAHGKFCPPRAVVEVLAPGGRAVPLEQPACRQALSPQVADTVTSVLRGTVDGPARGRTARRADLGRPVAGKTGSTNGSQAAWFVGFVPHLAAAVWVGKPVPEPLVDVTVGGTYYRQVYGGTLPAPIWSDVLRPALADVPVAELPARAVSRPRPPERPEGERAGERSGERSGERRRDRDRDRDRERDVVERDDL